MLSVLAAVLLLALPAAPYEKLFKPRTVFADFGEHETLSDDIVNIGLDDFVSLKGIHHFECPAYKDKCKEYIMCSIDFDRHLLRVSELTKATFAAREEDLVDDYTNPCVAMYALCIPAPYSQIKEAFKLRNPYHY